jgi:glycine cleavage system H protein
VDRNGEETRMIPKDLRYTRSHEWVRAEGDTCTIGITHFAVEQLTDPVNIELPKVGKEVTAEKSFGEIESVKAVSDLYAPISGAVVEVNEAVRKDPALVATDPYGQGWMIKVRVSSPAELQKLLSPEQYEQQIASH